MPRWVAAWLWLAGCDPQPGACIENQLLPDFTVRSWCAEVDRPDQCPVNQRAEPYVWELEAGSCAAAGYPHPCDDGTWEDLESECSLRTAERLAYPPTRSSRYASLRTTIAPSP